MKSTEELHRKFKNMTREVRQFRESLGAPTRCRSRGDGPHEFGEKKGCIKCLPVTKLAKTKESKK